MRFETMLLSAFSIGAVLTSGCGPAWVGQLREVCEARNTAECERIAISNLHQLKFFPAAAREACEAGVGTSCYQAAEAAYDAGGDPQAVVEWHGKGCDLGHLDCCVELACIYAGKERPGGCGMVGSLPFKEELASVASPERTLPMLQDICEKQKVRSTGDRTHTYACVLAGHVLVDRKDYQAALGTFDAACKMGDEAGCCQAGHLLNEVEYGMQNRLSACIYYNLCKDPRYLKDCR